MLCYSFCLQVCIFHVFRRSCHRCIILWPTVWWNATTELIKIFFEIWAIDMKSGTNVCMAFYLHWGRIGIWFCLNLSVWLSVNTIADELNYLIMFFFFLDLQSRHPRSFHHSRCCMPENLSFLTVCITSWLTDPPILTIVNLRSLTSLLHMENSKYYR